MFTLAVSTYIDNVCSSIEIMVELKKRLFPMASKHMNLKRISHRIKEEVGSTVEVANVVGIRGAFATFRGKVDIQIMVHNGHIEHPWIKKHLIKKHEARIIDAFVNHLDIGKYGVKPVADKFVLQVSFGIVQDDSCIVAAEAPAALIKHSPASPSLIATILYEKYMMYSPFYRQQAEWSSREIPFSRATMARWCIRCSLECIAFVKLKI